jgi:hypothetical protein
MALTSVILVASIWVGYPWQLAVLTAFAVVEILLEVVAVID